MRCIRGGGAFLCTFAYHMKYYIIAGEASGDLHGSNLIKAIHQRDASADIACWGGEAMQQAGATLVKHYSDLAFMGFAEVLLNIRTILNNISFCKQDIEEFKPDVLILIDYPGFNLRIAEWAHGEGIKVVYYISPQVWAWKENRVKKIKKNVDLMLVILPFEKPFYTSWNYEVVFVGHPLLDALSTLPAPTLPFEKPVIALLPGSRRQEIKTMLPVMLEVADAFPQFQFVIAQAPSQPDSLYDEIIGTRQVARVQNKTYALLQIARAALVTSGTATLETALFRVPQVVCYKGNVISYHIARRLIKIKYISLVNLILDKPCVTELIQDAFTREQVITELKKITEEGSARKAMLNDYETLRDRLGREGASQRAAEAVCQLFQH